MPFGYRSGRFAEVGYDRKSGGVLLIYQTILTKNKPNPVPKKTKDPRILKSVFNPNTC
jgi:hypothetical protein